MRAATSGITLLLLCGIVRPTSAQLQIGPVIGFNAPTSKFHVAAAPFLFENQAKQHLTFMYGGEARFWVDRRFGLQAELTHGASDVVRNPFGPAQHASVTVGIIEALVRFPLGDLSNRVWLAGGATYVKHGGAQFKSLSNTDNVGAAVGVGTQFQLAEAVRLDLGFHTLIYSFAPGDSLGTVPSATQLDFNVRVGLSVSLGRDRDDF
jgi:hypothetical protein